MAVSQNGYTANDRSFITTYEVTKTGRRLALRSGPAGQLLAHWVRWFDENIRDIDPGILDDWGYAERAIRGGVQLSNHASGTAADVDATKWPLGVEPSRYLTAAEIAKIRQHLKAYEGCIRWGGDYTGRKDPMHFEINRPEADCARVLKKLLEQQQEEEDDMSAEDVQALKDHVDQRINDLAGRVTTQVKAIIGFTDQRVNNLVGHIDGRTAEATKTILDAVTQLDGVDVDEETLRPIVEQAIGFTASDLTGEAARQAVDEILDRLNDAPAAESAGPGS